MLFVTTPKKSFRVDGAGMVRCFEGRGEKTACQQNGIWESGRKAVFAYIRPYLWANPMEGEKPMAGTLGGYFLYLIITIINILSFSCKK